MLQQLSSFNFPDARMGSKGRTTQEVAMTFLRRQSPDEKKKVQQERLVNRDFPWLWAVRDHWVFPRGLITVHYPDQWFMDFLRSKCSDRFEIWVCCGWESDWVSNFEVRKVIGDPQYCWAAVIRSYGSYWVTNVVVIERFFNTDSSERDFFLKIYRPTKPQTILNPYLWEVGGM